MSIKKPRGSSKSAMVGLTEKRVSGTGQELMVHSKAMCVGGCVRYIGRVNIIW